ncbi:DUF6993 domain-containing protein [Subtercola lobariae]|uniref:DUF6993 domain-containing protein n=1 Tax=Subtercola lobariae TaxID=1588641 RepID=UPI001E5755CF|nr:hypothetical protein [Subtercola lobariae]
MLAAALACAALAGALAACTSTPGPAPASSTSATSTSVSGTPTPTATPVLVPGGTAAENLAYFDYVNSQTISTAAAQNQTAGGVAFTSALRTGGFAIADMQVTPDITTVGVKADSIQFSVAMKGQCLVGQYGFGQYHSLVAPLLGTGKCLIGDTRAIDW